ncbi:MAG: hypothetical protein IPP17_22915 [Bacteroidetes bacterium]|nr:hypothetical protein [Bacteroidota bacterium]
MCRQFKYECACECGGDAGSGGFNFETGQFDVTIDAKHAGKDFLQCVPTLGDELQHAFQFEVGEIGFAQLSGGGAIIPYGYDVDDILESQNGAWRAVYAFAIANNPNFDRKNQDQTLVEFARYNLNYRLDGISNESANQAFIFHSMVLPDENANAEKWLFSAKGNYKATDFQHGQDKMGQKTTDFSGLKVGNRLSTVNKNITQVAFRGKVESNEENEQQKQSKGSYDIGIFDGTIL